MFLLFLVRHIFLTKIDSKKIFNAFLVLIFLKKKFWGNINTKKKCFFQKQ